MVAVVAVEVVMNLLKQVFKGLRVKGKEEVTKVLLRGGGGGGGVVGSVAVVTIFGCCGFGWFWWRWISRSRSTG